MNKNRRFSNVDSPYKLSRESFLKTILKDANFRLCMRQGNVPLHVLWQRRWIQFQNIYSTCSRTLMAYLIVFDFRFPDSKAKYQLNCYILGYDVQRSRKASKVFWIPSNLVHFIETVSGPSKFTMSPPHFSYTISGEGLFLETGTIGHRGGDGSPGRSEKNIQQVEELF